MKDKIESIISRMVFLGITGALLMGGSSSCNKDKDKQNQAPAPSYDAHDVKVCKNSLNKTQTQALKPMKLYLKKMMQILMPKSQQRGITT